MKPNQDQNYVPDQQPQAVEPIDLQSQPAQPHVNTVNNRDAKVVVSSDPVSGQDINHNFDSLPEAQTPIPTHTNNKKLRSWLATKHFGFKNVELILIILVIAVGSFFTFFMIHRHNSVSSSAHSQCDPSIYNQYGVCTSTPPEYLGDNHDIKVTKDLNTIDTDLNKFYGQNGPLDNTITGNIDDVGVSGLNYPLSSYKVTDISYGEGNEGNNLTYTVCAKFDTNTNTSSNTTSSNYVDSFNLHGRGSWCFNVNDNDGPDSGMTGSPGS